MDESRKLQMLQSIIDKLRRKTNGNELSHIELKENNISGQTLGESISAIANVCIYEGKDSGYILYGVKDRTLEEVGVKFDPFNIKISGNQDLEIWLRQMVLGVDFRFIPIKTPEGRDFLIIEVSKALGRISVFQKKAYIRIGKNTSLLSSHTTIEGKIHSKLDKAAFWRRAVKTNLTTAEILELLDHECYFQQIQLPYPTEPSSIMERFEQEGFIFEDHGEWAITNLGALLFAKDMKMFDLLQYKTPRVITYDGDTKLDTVIKDHSGFKGYANGFEALMSWVYSQIPEPQIITKIFREQRKYYPNESLRELIANALIHQDCEEGGMRPIIEIYKNHIEISNPGNCLVSPERILDAIPKARNEIMVDVMKRLNICESRGSGIRRTIEGIEELQLPAPNFNNLENGFRVAIYSYKPFDSLDTDEKMRACVQHVTLMYILRGYANNETLRKRFGVGEKRVAISKLVKSAKEKNLIKDFDPKNSSKKFIKYVPIWA